jgi:preprotein translocase subunit SecF
MKYNITAHRKLWLTFSGIVVVICIALVSIFGMNLGLDFLGGLRWTVQFNQPVQSENLAGFFDGQGLDKKVQIQKADENKFLVTLESVEDSKLDEIKSNMTEKFGEYKEIAFRRVDSSIGSHFKTKAMYAIFFALAGIIIFVAIAFRKVPKTVNPWRFGAVAIIALIHDILIIVAVFAVLGYFVDIELDLQFITALLATLGFSVNDTIVILDRVRENINTQKSRETFEDVIEKSIQQTLRRSINTSVSTLLPLIGLLIFGSEAIFYFILALTVGIVAGTYSSIFIAAPALAAWKNLVDKGEM